MLSERDLGWTVGFLEGEGSFSLSGGTPAKHPRVQATQVELMPLERLKILFGGGISPKKPSGVGKQLCHSWALTQAPQAVGLMMTIYPLMSPKRQEQIRHCLSIWKATPPNHGEKHRNATVTDKDAIHSLKRLLAGETMSKVAKDLHIERTALSQWVGGTKRGYLLAQLSEQERESLRRFGARYKPVSTNDIIALSAMRRVMNGEGITAVAKSIGVSLAAVQLWMRGARKPHLLAMMKEG